MEIQYIYKIISVDYQTKTMEIRYESAEFGEINISTRMPLEGEPLENVVRQYSPIALWREQIAAVENVEVNSHGVITYTDEISVENLAYMVRAERNNMMLLSDYTQLPDAPTHIDVEEWKNYRQLLRDIPQQEGFPTNIIWPAAPDNR